MSDQKIADVAEPGYGFVAKFLHWLIFALMVTQYSVAFLMPHIGGPKTQLVDLIAWHFSLGTTILFFAVLRLVWRVTHPVPLLTTIPVWQQRLARAVHDLIYVFLIALPVLGWIAAGNRGWDVRLFGVFTLPQLGPTGARWAHTAGDVHVVLSYAFMGVLALHIVGALYHYFIMRDRVLQRMLAG